MSGITWQQAAAILTTIVLAFGGVTYTDLLGTLFQLKGMDYNFTGDITCGTDCDNYIDLTTSYWRVCFAGYNDTKYENETLFKKVSRSRTLHVNLDNVDNIITTQKLLDNGSWIPYDIEVDWLVPTYGHNWRPIKDGDCWDRGKVNKIKLVGHKELNETIKWSFGLDTYVDIDPLWEGYTYEKFFTNLTYNAIEGDKGIAIFEVTNPMNIPLIIPINAWSKQFDKVNGDVKSSKIEWIDPNEEIIQQEVPNETCIESSKPYCYTDNITFNITCEIIITQKCSITGTKIVDVLIPKNTQKPLKVIQLDPNETVTLKLTADLVWSPQINIDWFVFVNVLGTNFKSEEWEWWNQSYGYKRQIEVNISENVTNYQMKIILINNTNYQTDWDDVRFTGIYANCSEDISQLRPYWIEYKIDSTNATISVNASFYTACNESTQLYMYYGNANVSDLSNVNDTRGQNIVGSWSFDGNANDYVLGNNGSVTSAVLTADRNGNNNAAYYFNGVDNKIDVGDAASLNVTSGSITISAWVYTNTTDTQSFVAKRDTNAPYTYHFGTQLSKLAFQYSNPTNNYYLTTQDWTAGEWQHVAVSFTYGASDTMILYINGSAVTGSWVGGDGSEAKSTTNENVYFGLQEHSSGYDLTGMLDEIMIFDRNLSATEINNLYLETEPIYSFGAEETIISFSGLSQSFNINSSTYDSLNLTFNVTSADLNTSLTKVYYAVNTTYNPDSYWSYINGTPDKCLTCFTSDITNIINDQYYTTLCSSYYIPATYNFIQDYMVSAPYQIEEITKTNSIKIKFQNITTEPNILYTLNAYIDNKTITDKVVEIWVCNKTYDFGDYETDERCHAIGLLNIDTPYSYVCANNSYNWIVLFSSDALGYLNGLKITSTMYVIFSTEISTSAKAWELRYITNNSNSYSTSTNNGGSWSNQIGTIAAHIHQRTSGITGISDQFLWYVYAENNDGTSANSTTQYDNITTISYPPTQPILLTPFYSDVWSGTNNITWTESNSPQGDNFTYNLYLYNVDGTYNQTLSTGIDKDITYYEWATYSIVDNGVYRINITVTDNNSLSTSYIHLRTFIINNTYPISVCINIYDEITGTKLYIDSEGYKVSITNSTTTTKYLKYISYKTTTGTVTNPTYACDKSKTLYAEDDDGGTVECYISLSSKNETIYYSWSSAYITPTLKIYNFKTSLWETKASGSSQTSSFVINNNDGEYTENDLSYIQFTFASGAATNFYYAFNYDNFYDNITLEHASEIVDIGVSDVLGDYAEHNYITNQVSNYSQDTYIIKLDDSITSCFTSISMLGVPIADTRFDFTRDGNIVTQHISDDSGNVGPRLDPTYLYTVVITNSEYGIRSFSLIPTTACTPLSYSVELNINYSSVIEDLYYSITPYHFLWENNNPNYAINVVASNNDLQSFGASISYPNGTIINTTIENASSGGGTIYISSDIGNYNGTLYLNLSFEKSGFDTYTVSKSVVLMYFEQLNDTLTGVLRRIRDGSTGIDLSSTEVSIMFIVFGFIIAIVTSEFGLMSTILLIIYAAIGVYLEIISMAVFIILSILAYILSHNGET